MKKVIGMLIIGITLLSYSLIAGMHTLSKSSNEYVKTEVVKIFSKKGSCTGVEVRGELTGNIYTLTAAHCNVIFKDPTYAEESSGAKVQIYEIIESPTSDLLLATPAGQTSMAVAKRITYGDPVFTMTHGAAFPAYRTDGYILTEQKIQVPLFPILNDEDAAKCKVAPKYEIANIDGLFGPEEVCALSVDENFASAWVVPGSSGGPLIDSQGNLIGIATASDGQFSTWVLLQDIHRFLEDK